MKIHKIILSWIVFLMIIATTSALVTYTGAPEIPYLAFGNVESNGDPVPNAKITVLNEATGYTTVITASVDGYWQQDTGNWLTTFGGRPPVQFGDKIIVSVSTSCASGDTCSKSFFAKTSEVQFQSRVDFALTGAIAAPPAPAPSGGDSGGGGGGSGGGGGGGGGTIWVCPAWSTCSSVGEQSRTCDAVGSLITKTETQECVYVAPTPQPEPEPETPVVDDDDEVEVTPLPIVEPPVEPEEETSLQDVLLRLIASVIGIFAWGAGFRGLIVYYLNKAKEAEKAGDKVLAKKHRDRAGKMARTVVFNFLAGKYKE